MSQALLLGVAAGLGVALPLGAVGVLLLQEALTRGWSTASAAATGVALVDGGYAVLAVSAGAAVTAALTGHERAVRLVGAAVLAGLAVHGALGLRRSVSRSPGRRPDEGSETAPDGVPGTVRDGVPGRRERAAVLVRFVLLTAANPTTAVYFTVLAAGLTASTTLDLADRGRATAFVLGILLGSWAWQLVLAAAGTVAGRRLPHRARWLVGAAGHAVVLGYAVLLALP